MDVREKLVEIIQNSVGGCARHWAEVISDGLIAGGVTVLPCNVGDKIYYIDRYTGKIDEDTVKFLTITKNGAKPILNCHNIKFWDFYELGKTAFLTKDEAEATMTQPPKGE